MTDLENARRLLEGHTLALCKGGDVILSDKRGIAPMLELNDSGKDLRGYSAADVVVGKAAAILFSKAGIAAVYAKTLSRPALKYLETQKIPVFYDTLADNIINRDKTDICPMEKAVLATDDEEKAVELLKEKFRRLNEGK